MESADHIDSVTYAVRSLSELTIMFILVWIFDGQSQHGIQWFIIFITFAGILEEAHPQAGGH